MTLRQTDRQRQRDRQTERLRERVQLSFHPGNPITGRYCGGSGGGVRLTAELCNSEENDGSGTVSD